MCYGVLVVVSNGYSPDEGKLLTRYAPLRRSPSIKPESSIMLPLDLHVLSLPLAFILSQDQTLHCIIFYITLSLSLTLIIIPINKRINASRFFSISRYLLLVQYKNSVFSMNLLLPFSLKRAAKIRTFFYPTNFFRLFLKYFLILSSKSLKNGFLSQKSMYL